MAGYDRPVRRTCIFIGTSKASHSKNVLRCVYMALRCCLWIVDFLSMDSEQTSPVDLVRFFLDFLIDRLNTSTSPIRSAGLSYVAALGKTITPAVRREPWFFVLVAVLLTAFLITTTLRRRRRPLFVIFVSALLLSACSRTINESAAVHHTLFSSVNPFSSSGAFIMAVWGLPFMCLATYSLFLLCCCAPWGLRGSRNRRPRAVQPPPPSNHKDGMSKSRSD